MVTWASRAMTTWSWLLPRPSRGTGTRQTVTPHRIEAAPIKTRDLPCPSSKSNTLIAFWEKQSRRWQWGLDNLSDDKYPIHRSTSVWWRTICLLAWEDRTNHQGVHSCYCCLQRYRDGEDIDERWRRQILWWLQCEGKITAIIILRVVALILIRRGWRAWRQ